jgi:hypothetical protein
MAPDAEVLTRAYLARELPDATVAGSVPKTMPDQLVTITRTGTWSSGPESETVDRPVLTIRSWGKTDNDARKLSRQVAGLMARITSESYFAYCSENSRYQTQGEGGEPQRVATYVLVVCGNE